jgi:hypothetical protein
VLAVAATVNPSSRRRRPKSTAARNNASRRGPRQKLLPHNYFNTRTGRVAASPNANRFQCLRPLRLRAGRPEQDHPMTPPPAHRRVSTAALTPGQARIACRGRSHASGPGPLHRRRLAADRSPRRRRAGSGGRGARRQRGGHDHAFRGAQYTARAMAQARSSLMDGYDRDLLGQQWRRIAVVDVRNANTTTVMSFASRSESVAAVGK